MNKLELIADFSRQAGLSKAESRKVVDHFFDALADALAKGDRVEIRGLCSFKIKQYDGYEGRNPKTGEPVSVKPKKLASFKPGQDLAKRVDS